MFSMAEDRLPDSAVQWVVQSVDSEASIQSVEGMKGGTSSLLHRLSLQTDQGNVPVVLRRFHKKEWLRQEPDLVRHEMESLRQAADVQLPTPDLIAGDETGNGCGMPAVLMTCLQGDVDLQPENRAQWLDRLAEALVRIHDVPAEGFPWTYRPYIGKSDLRVPTWTRAPGAWQRALDRVMGAEPSFTPRFIHRDFHPANLLWSGGQVSGVVDWVNACQGPAAIDVGHCRVNLAMLFDVASADQFLAAYQDYAGSAFCWDPYWDLLSLFDFGSPQVYAGWEAFGISGLTEGLIKERVDRYIITLVKQLSS
ncbi:MAG: aminoglycoside phosphotransferase family protein [Firmicutes bacterium]|nr:aminoglycoside phosphotransferase family protein [Bacillota bacterium]